jgi:hypothetical protein
MMKRILNDSKIIYLTWSLFISYPLLSFLRYKLFILNNYNFIFGELFWKVLLWTPYITGAISMIILIYWVFRRIKNGLNHDQTKAVKFVIISSIIYFVAGRIIIFIENSRYANFIYTSIGIDIGRLELSTTISWFLIITITAIETVLNNSFVKKIGCTNKIAMFLLCYALYIFLSLSAYSIATANVYSQIARASYEQKFGSQINYLEQIKKDAPENGIIIHPPRDSRWPAVGNQAILRYFLFPRVLVDGYLMSDQAYTAQFKEAYFQEIELGNDKTHWPQIDKINSEIVFDGNHPIKYKKLTLVSEDNSSRIYRVIFK